MFLNLTVILLLKYFNICSGYYSGAYDDYLPSIMTADSSIRLLDKM